MSSCTYYDMLKKSPLAKGRDDSTSETSSLDNAMIDKKFIDFAKKTRNSHREKSMKLKSEYMWQTIISHIDQ